jgi:hypothetical protein
MTFGLDTRRSILPHYEKINPAMALRSREPRTSNAIGSTRLARAVNAGWLGAPLRGIWRRWLSPLDSAEFCVSLESLLKKGPKAQAQNARCGDENFGSPLDECEQVLESARKQPVVHRIAPMPLQRSEEAAHGLGRIRSRDRQPERAQYLSRLRR